MSSNSTIQYAVLHLQRGSGNDSGMSTHIERKTADGKLYVPGNADARRTHLNRELVRFPKGVHSRTDAIQHRIDNAGLHRKVGSNQTKVLRIILTGTHEQMMEIERMGKLDDWADANLHWLKTTFGEENLVSCVLHMDEKTPHLHATVVPIVTSPRVRRKREGEKKNKTKDGPRLSADDMMKRTLLRKYQDTYAAAMKPFSLQRGVVGSTAKHQVNSTYYKETMVQLENDIANLQEEVERAKEGRSKFFSFFGRGELKEAKDELTKRDEEIARLHYELAKVQSAKVQVQNQYKEQIAKLRNGYQAEIQKAINEAEKHKNVSAQKDVVIERQKTRIDELDRIAHPQRYCLSSGAELVHHFIPNYDNPSIHIWTKVGDEEYDTRTYIDYFSDIWTRFRNNEATVYELINDVFEPQEQVNEAQAQLLDAALTLAMGGPAQAHVGTGGGGSQSDLPWGEKKNNVRKGR